MRRWHALPPVAQAVLLAALSSFCFAVETAMVKALTGAPLATVVFFRALGQVLWMVPMLLREGRGLFATRQPALQWLRGALSVASWWLFYYGFSHLPLATATVLSFTSVLFTTALAGPILGEAVRWRRWSATLLGFAGVLVVLRPDTLPVGWPVIASLASALLGAGIVLTTRHLAKTERSATIMAYIGVVAFLGSAPFALPGLGWTGWKDAALLVGMAVLGPIAMTIWIQSLRLADASIVGPVTYLRLVFAGAAGIWLFGEAPTLSLLAGSLLIVASALYITRREALVARARRQGT